jgi:hypothetical protein
VRQENSSDAVHPSGWGNFNRQMNCKRAALIQNARHRNVASVQADQLVGNRQPYPHPLLLYLFPSNLPEALKEMRNLVRWNSHTIVGHGNIHPLAYGAADGDDAVLSG